MSSWAWESAAAIMTEEESNNVAAEIIIQTPQPLSTPLISQSATPAAIQPQQVNANSQSSSSHFSIDSLPFANYNAAPATHTNHITANTSTEDSSSSSSINDLIGFLQNEIKPDLRINTFKVEPFEHYGTEVEVQSDDYNHREQVQQQQLANSSNEETTLYELLAHAEGMIRETRDQLNSQNRQRQQQLENQHIDIIEEVSPHEQNMDQNISIIAIPSPVRGDLDGKLILTKYFFQQIKTVYLVFIYLNSYNKRPLS